MPRIEDVIANNLAPQWEVVPSVGRILDFALTVRDNDIDGGESHTDFMEVTVSNEAGPFVITSPNTAIAWEAATNKEITWDVAGTTANGVNTPFVDILLSTDGGFTYPTVLAAKVPNDGSETVIVPNVIGATNRIMVRGHENIFYDISNSNISITNGGSTFIAAVAGPQNTSACKGSDVVYNFAYSNINGFAGITTFTVSGNPEGSTVNFTPATVNANTNVQMTVGNTADAESGFYTLTVTMTSGAVVKTINVYLTVLDSDFETVALISPVDMTVGAGQGEALAVTLEWSATANATLYTVQVSESEMFIDFIAGTTTADTAFVVNGLEEGQTYFWRVAPANEACTGAFGDAFSFTTGEWSCSQFAAQDIPVAIPDDAAATVISQIVVEGDAVINTAMVILDITHTWLTDLRVKLISPAGTEVNLFADVCGDFDNAVATFDDSGAELTCNDEFPAISGTIRPQTPLSALNGESVAGIWTLEVTDAEPWDGGSINSWSLNLCSVVPPVLSIDKNTLFDFVVYPNPNNGSFNVAFASDASGPVTLTVYDMRGRRIYEKATSSTGGSFSEKIELTAESGVYMLNIDYNGGRSSRKIVLK
jgi:subtilisin-like proprotein convertase family protein